MKKLKKAKKVLIVTANGPGTLGGPMGTEHEGPTEWRKVCLSVPEAKRAAQSYFDKRSDKEGLERKPITWNGGRGADMLWLLFHIESVEVV